MNQDIKILDYRNFDFNQLQYYDPLQSRGGAYLANISYLADDKSSVPIYIQTPKLKVVGGVTNTIKKTYIELELDSSENVEFYNFLTKFEEMNLIICHRKSKKWFGRHFPLEEIDKSYQGCIKPNRGKSPSIKVNLQIVRGQVLTEIYKDETSQISMDYVQDGDYVICILEISCLRFLKSKFSCDINVSQIRVFKPELKSKLTGYHINDEMIEPINFVPGSQDDSGDEIDEIQNDISEHYQPQSNHVDVNYKLEHTIPNISNNSNNPNNPNISDKQLSEQDKLIQLHIEQENMIQQAEKYEQEKLKQLQIEQEKLMQLQAEEAKLKELQDEQEKQLNIDTNNHTDENDTNIRDTNDDFDYHRNEITKTTGKNNDFLIEELDDLSDCELGEVNFGINKSMIAQQIEEQQTMLRKLMSNYEDFQEKYQQEANQFRNRIQEQQERYREQCHRYNIIPEF